MSSAIPKARFSIGVKAPEADALLQSPSDRALEFPSSSENLASHKRFHYSALVHKDFI